VDPRKEAEATAAVEVAAVDPEDLVVPVDLAANRRLTVILILALVPGLHRLTTDSKLMARDTELEEAVAAEAERAVAQEEAVAADLEEAVEVDMAAPPEDRNPRGIAIRNLVLALRRLTTTDCLRMVKDMAMAVAVAAEKEVEGAAAAEVTAGEEVAAAEAVEAAALLTVLEDLNLRDMTTLDLLS